MDGVEIEAAHGVRMNGVAQDGGLRGTDAKKSRLVVKKYELLEPSYSEYSTILAGSQRTSSPFSIPAAMTPAVQSLCTCPHAIRLNLRERGIHHEILASKATGPRTSTYL